LINKTLVRLFIVVLVLWGVGCMEDPSSIGGDLLNNDLIEVKVFDTTADTIRQASSTYNVKRALGASEMLLLGAAGNVKSSILIRYLFNFPDSIRNEINNNNLTVVSSSVRFTQKYRAGEVNAPFNFTAHKVNSGWTSGGFTSDSLIALSFNEAVDEASNKLSNDSIMSFTLSNEVAQEWINAAADTNVQDGWGMIVRPTTESQKLVGYQALVPGSSVHSILTVVVSKPGAYTDTLQFLPTSDISVVEGNLPDLNNNEFIAVQSGFIINSKLWFDISTLPTDMIMNRAELVLSYDSTRSLKGSEFRNAIEVYRVIDSTRTDSLAEGYLELSYSDGFYRGDVTNYVREWRSNNNNQGVILKSSAELDGAELFVLGGSMADSTRRPRLIITYTSRR
jgi:hypothetical protein